MATAELERTTQIVAYSVTDEKITELRNEFEGSTAITKEGYEDCRRGIAICRNLRSEVEKKRVELKADALAYGRKVDSEAKRITAMLTDIEEPLKLEKAKVDDEKDRIKREKEAAELAKVEAELKAKRDAEEAAAKAVREAEAAKLAEERKKLDAERAAIDAERAKQRAEQDRIDAAQRAEREKIEAERLAVERQKQAAELAEFERQAKVKAEEDARAKVEQERVEADRRQQELERSCAEHVKQMEALKPDKEKIHAFAARLRTVEPPNVKTAKAAKFINGVLERLNALKVECEQF